VKFLADENLPRPIVDVLLRRLPDLDIVSVVEVGLRGRPDPEILEWAAAEGRILVTFDVRTIPRHVEQRVAEGRRMPGVFLCRSSITVRQAIEDLLILAGASGEGEWEGKVLHLPL
jgi:hypothetical protein